MEFDRKTVLKCLNCRYGVVKTHGRSIERLSKKERFCSRKCAMEWRSQSTKGVAVETYNEAELQPITVPQCLCRAGWLNYKCHYNQLPYPTDLTQKRWVNLLKRSTKAHRPS